MENEKLTRKQIIPIIVGVLTLVVLVASATYAYFSVTAGNSSGTTTIIGDIGGDTLGTVTLTGGNTQLYLGVSADDMSETNKGKIYYSSTEEGSRETNVNSAGKTTYTATLSGDETDEVMYACDYEFTVTSTGTTLGKESINDLELVFSGDIEKAINLTGTDKVSGTWFGFKNSNKERTFNAYLQLTNTEEEQNDIAGTNLSVSISNTKWKCYLSELGELVGEAYALYTESNSTLTFVRSETPYNVGDAYNDIAITEVYTGFEVEKYENSNQESNAPWYGKSENIENIIFEDEIRPRSTSNWFYGIAQDECGSLTIDVTNLNTSLVTDMSYMFTSACYFGNINIIGVENFNTSNVTNMSYMFSLGDSGELAIDLSNWDVSNVTDMSGMFWTYILTSVGDISNWDVSNVTDMSYMFYEAIINDVIDLSEWDVSNVINYNYFDSDIAGTGALTPPVWQNAIFSIYSEDDKSLRLYSNLESGEVPLEESTYDGRKVTKVKNMSLDGFSPITCSSTIVPIKIIVEDNISPTSTFSWFKDCTKVNYIDVSKLDTSNVTNMYKMFYNVGSDTSVTNMTLTGIENLNTSNVTNMQETFYNFGKNATYTLDLSGWDVSSIKRSSYYKNFNYGVETKVITPNWPTNS